MFKVFIPILLLTACAPAFDPANSSVSVKLDKDNFNVGEPITGVVSWKGAPSGSSVGLTLKVVHDEPAGIRRSANQRPFVSSGTIWASAVSGTGSQRFKWSGNGVPCYASSDLPETCPETAAPGPQAISAVVYDPSLVEHPMTQHRIGYKPKDPVLFKGQSAPFMIHQPDRS